MGVGVTGVGGNSRLRLPRRWQYCSQMLQHLQRLRSCQGISVSRLGLVKPSSHIAWRGLFRLWVKRRRFWYSESSVAADKPDNLSSAPRLADSSSLTLAYATGDLGYAIGKTKDCLFNETCSTLMPPYVSEIKYRSETKHTFAIPTPRSWLPRMTAPVKGS